MYHAPTNPSCSQCSRNELEALYRISRAAAAETDQRSTLQKILRILEKNLHMIRGTIMLLMPDNDELAVKIARQLDNPGGEDARYHLGEGIMGTVVETGKPVVVPSIQQEPRFQDRIHRRGKSKQTDFSFICVPVAIENEVVGALSVDLPNEKRDLLDRNTRVITIVASMIANHLRTQRRHLMEREALKAENAHLRGSLGERFRPDTIVGNSRAMNEIFTQIHLLAQSDTTVCIRGPSGTGKELIASAIHYKSARRDAPFIRVNCSALNENLLESELFGHEKGAFSGAQYRRKGRIEEAQGGTLLLDEIGDFSPPIQVKLLRVIQERQFERVGSNVTQQADIRLITATNRDLEEMVRAGSFREDLYYRINVFPVYVPPLRDRREDILPLVNHFISKFSRRMHKTVRRVTTEAINMLMAYHWPGNIRELENSIEYAVLLSRDGVIYGHHLPPTLQIPAGADDSAGCSLKSRVRTLERDMITDALKRNKGNMSAAARELGITIRMIRYKIENLQIDYEGIFRRRHGSST
jgi:Nif-specific regulatory protein